MKYILFGFLTSLTIMIIVTATTFKNPLSELTFYEDGNAKYTEYRFDHLNRFTYRNKEGKVVLVNNSRRVMEFEFNKMNKLQIDYINYYYEFQKHLFVERYQINNFQMCMMNTTEIDPATLKGSKRIWLRSEVHNTSFHLTGRSIEGYTKTPDMCTCNKVNRDTTGQ